MVIQHNLAAMAAQRYGSIVRGESAKSTEKLSSGYKINKAADDAAGLSISEKMRKQIRGLNMGISNAEDGISLCQVADGALNEVHDILQRMNELAVKAANGTNSDSDRKAINDEIEALVDEVDRISDTTKFNEYYVFRKDPVYLSTTTASITNSTAVNGFSYNDVQLNRRLGDEPFNTSNSSNRLLLSVYGDNGEDTKKWRIIYGDHYTGSIRINTTTTSRVYDFSSLQSSDFSRTESGDSTTWERTYSITDDIKVKQAITMNPKTDESQYYSILYTVVNNSGSAINFDFLHHEDTAFNNKDAEDSYHINGAQVENMLMYTTDSRYNVINNSYVHTGTMIDSISITNLQNPIGFTENINLSGSGEMADTFLLCHYSQNRDWSAYEPTRVTGLVGGVTHSGNSSRDLGFGLVWHDKTIGAGSSLTMGFKQGIRSIASDDNLSDDAKDLIYQNGVANSIVKRKQLWIQSGAETGDGICMKLGVMSSRTLDIKDASVLTETQATELIDTIAGAMREISKIRSLIGAQQNRLEHTVKNEENIVENTIASESQIRDTDMAGEMVIYSNLNILMQSSNSMLSQANQKNQGILSLIA